MPTKLFFELNRDKQIKILSAAISEFATHGYTNSSTNSIVKNCGISKGSLFKYFDNKEELYFYILDTVTAEFAESIGAQAVNLSHELFERIIEYSALEFSWYIQNPEKSKLIVSAFTKSDTKIYQKTVARYSAKELDMYCGLLKDVDFSNYRCDKQKAVEILKWVLKGFNDDFAESVQNESYSFEHLHDEYVRSLTGYIEILKSGFLK